MKARSFRRLLSAGFFLFGASSARAQDGGPFEGPTPEAVAARPRLATPIVATHYFYWYREPGEHMDQLGLHFPEGQRVDHSSSSWHRKEMEDVVAAGIDVVLPVYWGVVDRYELPGIAFSVRGLPPLVEALDQLVAAGRRAPRIGMFYDTSTWLASVRNDPEPPAKLDLRTEKGFDILYRTVRDFFRQVPPRHWACLKGEPLVVFYSAAFASGYDASVFEFLRERFAADFHGVRPHLILDASFQGVEAQGRCRWGAALHGPFLEGRVAQIGAGYDDRAVRGRTTPIREREEGRFYDRNWQAVLAARPDLVLIETWNEHHEGTSINETLELGRSYIERTAHHVRRLKAGETLEGEILLEYEHPVARRDESWGRQWRGSQTLQYVAPGGEHGLRPIACEDGPHEVVFAGEGSALGTRSHPFGDVHYLYFQVADACWHEVRGRYQLTVQLWDGDPGPVHVEYDSHDREATLRGAYTPRPAMHRGGEQTWRTLQWELEGARFANRQNGAADFRLVAPKGPLRVGSVTLTRRP